MIYGALTLYNQSLRRWVEGSTSRSPLLQMRELRLGSLSNLPQSWDSSPDPLPPEPRRELSFGRCVPEAEMPPSLLLYPSWAP